MVAGNGVPIRLVHEDGSLTELDAQSIALTTQRKAGGMSTPFSGGQRVGLDMNMNKALIIVNGVITDDKQVVGSDTASSAIVDFTSSVTTGATESNLNFLQGRTQSTNGNVALMFNANNSYVSGSDTFSHTTLELISSDKTTFSIKFKKLTSGTVTASSDGSLVFGINPDASLTALILATNLISLVSGESTLNAKFSVAHVFSQVTNTTGAVKITQKTAGTSGDNKSPAFRNILSGFRAPVVTDFTGGSTASKKSAGDKAMDLYGLSNNMKRTGLGKYVAGAGLVLGGVVGSLATGGVGVGVGAGVASVGLGMMTEGALGHGSDYIVGIQIPYNSTIQADGETFVARNFIMPTGFGKTRETKTSVGNSRPVSADLTKDGNRAGIKGVMNKLDIQYEAGQNVYTFVLNFIPVDHSV